MKQIDLTGLKFGKLIVIGKADNKNRRINWYCNCECGTTDKSISGEALKAGLTKSCGCIKVDLTSKLNLSHGETINKEITKEYRAWNHAKSRCYNVNDKKYKNYGLRGIIMCNKWLNNFELFLKDMGRCPIGLTLERINVNGNYEPFNCRWATYAEQGINKTNNRLLTHDNKTQTLSQWSRELNIDIRKLHKKLKKQSLTQIIEIWT